ncbi:MAG: twin-arginine translocase TatA/TatE family subunit [Candidatus Caldarchaeales archaeon]
MAVAGLEWVVIAILIIVLILWGPSQIPKIARAFGQAKKEFQKAAKEAESASQEAQSTVGEALQPFTETVNTLSSETQKLESEILKLAKMLNISTEGKTRDQIANEIAKKLSKQ